MKRTQYQNFEFNDLLHLDEFSPSKNKRCSTPMFDERPGGSSYITSSSNFVINDDTNVASTSANGNFVEDDSDPSSDNSDCSVVSDSNKNDKSCVTDRLWQCTAEEFSQFTVEHVRMILTAIQCYGRLPDVIMEMFTKFLLVLLPKTCKLRGTYKNILSEVQLSRFGSDVATLHYLCSKCCTNMPKLFSKCSKTSCARFGRKHHASAFVCLQIRSQLEQIIKATFSDMIKYVSSTDLDRDSDSVGDVITGKSYRKYGQNPDEDGTFFISLVLSADGASAFKASSSSLWPCGGLIIELPPKKRCMFENSVGFGFWIGRDDKRKPNWNLFLDSIIDELQFLNNVGFLVEVGGRQQRFKIRLHATVFDSPALASAWSIKQFNGKYGCVKCMHPGKQQSGPRRIYSKRQNVVQKDRLFYEKAWASIDSGLKHICVKERSPLSKICNPASHNVLDPMHMVYLGNARRVFVKIFKGQSGPAILKPSSVTIVDKTICNIRFPHEFSRRVPPLADLKTFKATELKNLLVYAVLPATAPLLAKMNPDLWHWLAVFVESIRLLAQRNCTSEDIKMAKDLIDLWQSLLPKFFGELSQTYNAHCLEHLPDQVANFGSLWSVNSFPFENFNGQYTRLVQSGKGVAHQLARRVLVSKTVKFWVREQKGFSNKCTQFLEEIFPNVNLYSEENDQDRIHLLNSSKKVPVDFYDDFKSYFNNDLENVTFAERASVNGVVFHSSLYQKRKKSTSASSLVALLLDNDSHTRIYGEIVTFFSISNEISLAYKKFDVTGDILDDVTPPANERLSAFYHARKYGSFFQRVLLTDDLYICRADQIESKFVLVPVDNVLYATHLLPFEHD